MRIRSFYPLIIALLFLAPGFSLAQDGKYITSATLQMFVGDDTKFFLNGHLVMEHDTYSYNDAELSKKGYYVYKFKDDQLCFFQPANVFAFQVSETLENFDDYQGRAWTGVAYILTLHFSDNTEKNYSSSEIDQHLEFDVTAVGSPDPAGWNLPSTDESGWKQPTGESKPPADLIQNLHDPLTHKPPVYLQAFQADDAGKFVGLHDTRRDYRRKFALNGIDPAPGCEPFKPTPTFTHPYQRPTATYTRTPVPTATPRPRPTATDTFTPRPIPTATYTKTPRPPRATATPTDTPRPRVVRIPPTATPRPIRHLKPPPTPTEAEYVPPTSTPTIRRRAWPTSTATPRPRYRPTFTPTVELPEYAPTTIVFVKPPVNIYVEFADGPGLYKLEVTDAGGNHVRTLLDRRMVGDSDQWLAWDGKNDQGQLMPYGDYYAVFTRNGKRLRNIILTWIRDPDNNP